MRTSRGKSIGLKVSVALPPSRLCPRRVLAIQKEIASGFDQNLEPVAKGNPVIVREYKDVGRRGRGDELHKDRDQEMVSSRDLVLIVPFGQSCLV